MNRTIQQHAKNALMVQDACNLSGVVHSLDTAVTDLWKEANRIGYGTKWVNTHPIVQAYIEKLHHLAIRLMSADEQISELDVVFRAFSTCREIAEE